METIYIKKLDPSAIVPEYAHDNDAGFDLHALEDVTLHPGETKVIPTGIAVELPVGFELQVRPRSGMSLKTPMLVANAPGTVDEGYRGEVGVVAYCRYSSKRDDNGVVIHVHGDPLKIKKGDRIAQAVPKRFEQVNIVEKEELSSTQRGTGGYGSTGK